MSYRSDSGPLWLYVPLFFALVLFGHWGCPNAPQAQRVLEAQGYTDITITGGNHGWSCGDDGSATGFTATGPTGGRLEGVVCCGIVVKACTVRIERAVGAPRQGKPQ